MNSPAPPLRSRFRNADTIAHILSGQYGDHAHGNKTNPLHELLYIICSLQTNEALYVATYRSLRSRFPSLRLLASASETEIGAAMMRGGLACQKARVISRILRRLITEFETPTLAPLRGMNDHECEKFLMSLPGVGKKTARCVMMYSLNRQVFPVDSNCWRIAKRLGWVRATRPNGSCSDRDMDRVQNGIAASIRHSLHVNLVSHGRRVCLPNAPKCGECCIRRMCRRIGV